MSKRYTEESFRVAMQEKYGNKYDYSTTKYISSNSKITVFCHKHGNFTLTANSHQQGQGCRVCDNEIRKLEEQKDFVRKCTDLHGDTSDFSSTVYSGIKGKATAYCKVHKCKYETDGRGMLLGRGCKECCKCRISEAVKSTTGEFVQECFSKFAGAFTYKEVDYQGATTPVSIKCNTCCSVFLQTPSQHLKLGRCSVCAPSGFKVNKSASLYILLSGDLVKVGITNNTAQARAKAVSRSSGSDFTVLASYSTTGKTAKKIEKIIISWLKSHFKNPQSNFEGYTECFVGADPQAVKEFAESLLANHNNLPKEL